jgi:hypothetical protein
MSKIEWTSEKAEELVRKIQAKPSMFYNDDAMYSQLIGWMKAALSHADAKQHAEYFFNAIKTLGDE